MKTSWNETRQIEASINNTLDTVDALLFEANVILNLELQDKVLWQQKTYAAIHQYGRNQLKKEIEAVHQKLFSTPKHSSFSQKIRQLFNTPL